MPERPPVTRRLERHFEFERLGTNWRTEILAGVPAAAAMAATCVGPLGVMILP